MAFTARDPFHLLREIESRARQYAAGLPKADEGPEVWPGVGFAMGGAHFVTEVGNVTEMITVPRLTRIPGVPAWVRGIANIRGTLVPILDAYGCLAAAETKVSRLSRVLVVRESDTSTGILVDEVSGLKHFPVTERSRDTDGFPEFARSIVDGSFQADGFRWGILDVRSLVKRSEFFQLGL